MPDIMSLLVFQSSRLQLLSSLQHRFNVAAAHRDEHVKKGEPEDDHEKKSIDNLLRAMEAADAQCKRLEFWSDFRSVAQEGGVLGAADHSHGFDHEWQDAPDSHTSESRETSPDLMEKKDKGKGRATLDHRTEDSTALSQEIDGASESKEPDTTIDSDKEEESTDGDDAFFSPDEGIDPKRKKKNRDKNDDIPGLAGKLKGEEE
jgi:hypothetical protein